MLKNQKPNSKRAFTIVELVIVIAVIAILAAVLIPTFSGIVDKANRSSALQEAKNGWENVVSTYLSYDTFCYYQADYNGWYYDEDLQAAAYETKNDNYLVTYNGEEFVVYPYESYSEDEVLEFTALSDGTYSVATKTGVALPERLAIPESHNGKPVTRITGIGSQSDRTNSDLVKRVRIPESVTKIDVGAFKCRNLTRIYFRGENENYHVSGNCLIETQTQKLIAGYRKSVIPSDGSVTEIADAAFFFNNGLASVTIPASVTKIGTQAFTFCKNLASVTISSGVTEIGEEAFSACQNLVSLSIANGLTSIGDWAFSGCSKLAKVTIPASVTMIGNEAFRSCTALANVVFAGDSGLTDIGQQAFYGCTALANFTIPNGITAINISAFSESTGLTSVTIPASVTSIGKTAFFECTSLSTIFYQGTEAQWNAVTKGEKWDYLAGSYTVVFNASGT